jgi:hypothetical protein
MRGLRPSVTLPSGANALFRCVNVDDHDANDFFLINRMGPRDDENENVCCHGRFGRFSFFVIPSLNSHVRLLHGSPCPCYGTERCFAEHNLSVKTYARLNGLPCESFAC